MRRSTLVVIIAILLLGVFFARRQPPRESQLEEQNSASTSPGQIPGTRTDVVAPASCSALHLTCTSQYFSAWQQPADRTCATRSSNGFPIPDAKCTPGGINPSVTAATLSDPAWTTKCIRDCESSAAEKHITYAWYSLTNPPNNNGPTQTCELDHLVPLEMGGADGLGNIWPMCGPDNAPLPNRYFKEKDEVENYLTDAVRKGTMSLADAQKGIAQDWTQYFAAAEQYCASGGRC